MDPDTFHAAVKVGQCTPNGGCVSPPGVHGEEPDTLFRVFPGPNVGETDLLTLRGCEETWFISFFLPCPGGRGREAPPPPPGPGGRVWLGIFFPHPVLGLELPPSVRTTHPQPPHALTALFCRLTSI